MKWILDYWPFLVLGLITLWLFYSVGYNRGYQDAVKLLERDERITGSRTRTSNKGTRVEMNSTGFRMYDKKGRLIPFNKDLKK